MTLHTNLRTMIAVLSVVLFSAFPVFAESEGKNNYINLSVGEQNFDNDRGLNSKDFFSLGYEHRYGPNWAFEILLMDSSPRPAGGGSNIDLTHFGIDALYYFDTHEGSNIQPYGAFGLGMSEFELDADDEEEGQARVGLGLRYLLGDHWSVRGDTRLLYSEESHTVDHTIAIGLSYAFSPQKARAKPAPVVVQEPEPAPEPDTDGDGVIDRNDDCPGTGAGILVDGNGCPQDRDNDGVPDYKDQCPDSPAGVAVDESGCSPDDDKDGVANYADECPNTEVGSNVDAKGCMLDGDNDGVGDHRDQCPDTPAGRQVDDKGCKFVLTRTEEMNLNVNFASNSSNVAEDQYADIERVAEFLQKYAGVTTVIEGHTDDRGAANYNQKLSQARANAVRNVLIERYGIAADRVTAAGFGESQPIQTNDTKAGRLANRRVVAVMKAQISE